MPGILFRDKLDAETAVFCVVQEVMSHLASKRPPPPKTLARKETPETPWHIITPSPIQTTPHAHLHMPSAHITMDTATTIAIIMVVLAVN